VNFVQGRSKLETLSRNIHTLMEDVLFATEFLGSRTGSRTIFLEPNLNIS
jgi:hypothetical protein